MKCNMRIYLSLLVAMTPFYVFSDANAQPIESISVQARCLNEEKIESFKQKITAELVHNTDLRAATKGVCYTGGAVIALLACYKLIKDWSIVSHDELVEMRRSVSSLKAVLASQVFRYNDTVQAAAAGLVNTTENAGFLSTVSNWGSTIIRFAGQTALSSFIAHTAQQFVSSIFHDQSIKWLLHSKTLLPDLLNQLETIKTDINNLKLNKTPLEITDYNQYVETLITLHNMTAEQLEFIVGYMRYKMSLLPLAAAGDLTDTKSIYLSNRVLFVTNFLNAEVATYNLSSTNEERSTSIVSMHAALEQLMLQISSALTQFEVIEKKMKQEK